MLILYRFRRENDRLVISKTSPAHEKTAGIFISEDEHGYGATKAFDEIAASDGFPGNMHSRYTYFECRDGNTGEYYRIPAGEINLTGDTILPDEPVKVRHAAWPGKDQTEIRAELMEQRERQIQRALKRARDKIAFEEQQARQRLQEEETRIAETAKIIETHGPVEDEIARRIREEFGDETVSKYGLLGS